MIYYIGVFIRIYRKLLIYIFSYFKITKLWDVYFEKLEQRTINHYYYTKRIGDFHEINNNE